MTFIIDKKIPQNTLRKKEKSHPFMLSCVVTFATTMYQRFSCRPSCFDYTAFGFFFFFTGGLLCELFVKEYKLVVVLIS